MEEKSVKKSRFPKITVGNLLTIITGLGTIFIKNSFLPEKVPLFYSRPWGEEQLAAKNWLYLIPAVSFFIFVVSRQTGIFLKKKNEDFLALIITICSLVFSLLGTVTVLKIVFMMS